MRNLVVCCDGTWNSQTNKDGQFLALTNVVRLHAAVGRKGTDGVEQLKYYREGVGNSGGKIRRLLGGAVGLRLEDDIQSAYKWLAEHFERGSEPAQDDRIFIFGFSRGAYTARSLAGMIAAVGLVDNRGNGLSDADKWARVKAAMTRYQEHKLRKRKAPAHGAPVAPSDGEYRPGIHFLGVWDTVGALGIPDDLGILKELLSDPDRHRFHDTVLGDSVLHARHAVSIDERRLDFTPTLWEEPKNRPAGGSFRQLWFSGVHGDVGGGYYQRGLGEITLQWMMAEAKAQTLGLRPGALGDLVPDPRGQLHDSLTGAFSLRPARPRAVPNLVDTEVQKTAVSDRVIDRVKRPAAGEVSYWETHDPAVGKEVTVDVAARDKWGWTGVYIRGEGVYDFTASGEWLDRDVKCGPDGVAPGDRAWGHRAGELSEMLRRGMRKVSGNEKALPLVFEYGRRFAGANWFALIGVVANGRGVDAKTMMTRDHEHFLIGSGRQGFEPGHGGGYLYTYANDAWRMYGNNRGMLKLTVTRVS